MANKNLLSLIRGSVAAAVSGCLLFLLCASEARAQQFYTAAVSSYNNFPFNGTTASGNMCQFLYFPADFNATPSGGTLITTVYFKAATTGSCTYTDLTIKLANTSLTALTSGTWNSGLTTAIYQASFTSSWTSGTWYAFTLATPFYYSGGNLLVEASQASHTSTGMGVWYYSGSVNKRMYGTTVSTTSLGADVSPLSFGFDVIPAACSGTPAAGSITNTPMSPANPICGTSVTLNGSNPGLGTGFTYSWQSSTTSATTGFSPVTTGSGATTLNYTTANIGQTTWFQLGITCTNSNITTYSPAYQVIAGTPQPGAISGRPTFCPGDTATYSVPAVFGTTYNWTLPAGWSGSSTTNSILTTMGGGSSNVTISVTASGPCGGPSIPQTRVLQPGSAPATPTAINGFNSICPSTTQTYSVAPVAAATSYTWTFPSGWTVTSSSATGPTITVQTNANGGNVSVKSVNGCGSSAAATMAVSIINALANPGVITSSAVNNVYCSGVLYNFSINPVPGATSYQWVLPSGWSGAANGTTAQAFAGTGSGQIQVTAFVSCATSPSATLSTPVTGTVNPAVTITPPPALCQGVPATFTAATQNGGSAPTYQWRKNGVNVFSIGNTYTDAALVSGDVVSVRLTSTASCRSADTVNSAAITAAITPSVTPGISINSTPVVTICAGTALNFTTTITGGGTAPQYEWYVNGGLVATSPNWSSTAISNGDTVTVKLYTNAACATTNVANSNKVGIKVNPLVSPSIAATASSTLANGSMVTFTATQSGGGSTPSYQWLLNGVEIPNATASTYSSDKLVPGDHISVRMLSYDPCANPATATSADIVLNGVVSVAGVGGWQGGLSLYPNPTATGEVTVSAAWTGNHAAGELVALEVLNAVGQSIYRTEVAPGAGGNGSGKWHYTLSLPQSAPAGHYILRLNATQSGMRANLPFVLNR